MLSPPNLGAIANTAEGAENYGVAATLMVATATEHAMSGSADLVREIWRLQRSGRVLMAGLYRHPRGLELRVGFEPTRGPGDILHTRVEQTTNMGVLELDAAGLRDRLHNAGWTDSAVD